MTADEEPDQPEYYVPTTLEEIHERLAEPGSRIIAGGQTLALLWRQGFLDVQTLIDVSRVEALSGISISDGVATIGATTTYAELDDHYLAEQVGMLGDACENVGDRQIRNAGTIGGAVAHADPYFDILSPLLCLEATLNVTSVSGSRRVPIDEFFVGHMETALADDELIERLTFELPDPGRTGTAYEKHVVVEKGWATVGAASLLTVEDGTITDACVGLTAGAATPVRSPAVEAELRGAPITTATISSASDAVIDDIDPLDDVSGSAAYKRRLAPEIVDRSLRTALDRAGGDL